jgi:hypothetical protein
MTPGQSFDCLYCLGRGCYELRISRKDTPYFICRQCGSRTFIHGDGLRGPQVLWGKLSLALSAGDVEAAKELVAREVGHAAGNHA